MADPLGIVGVVGVAAQIIQAALQLGLDWKDAPADAKQFLNELQTLKTILSVTYTNILTNDDFQAAFYGRDSALLSQLGPLATSTNASAMVSICKQELDDLLSDLMKQAYGSKIGWERLKGAFLSKKRRETVEYLQRQCESLNRLLAIDALALASHTHQEVIEARKEQRIWQAGQEGQSILDWITTTDYSDQQSDFLRRRQEGTGQWLLHSKHYQQWVEAIQQTLFCPGIPGAGKTILTSIVIDDLHDRFRDDRQVAVAFLYCNFRREADQMVEHLLSSLLKQLSRHHASLPECVRSLYEKHKGQASPSLEELSLALQTVALLFSRVFIVVDALDECQLSSGSREKFITEIFALQKSCGANIFATSRHIQSITDRFKDSTSVEIRAHTEDIRRYLQGNMAYVSTVIARSPDLQNEVMTKIVEVIDGMFLLAKLHLDSLKGMSTVKAVRIALRTLQAGSQAYDNAYNEAMKRIQSQLEHQSNLAKQALLWITCAKRPLSTTELQHALAVEIGETRLDPDNMSQLEDIISVCAGLVTVDDESSVIRLVHYTTQEYFERSWTRWFPNAQAEITEICLAYLEFSACEGGPWYNDEDLKDRLRLAPLFSYASHYWGHHARDSGEASQAAIRLLTNEHHLKAQAQALAGNKRLRGLANSQDCEVGMQRLHVAAYFGLNEVVEHFLDKGDSPDTKDCYGRTPLLLATQNGHEQVVKMLAEKEGVNVNSKGPQGMTSLSLAALMGNEKVAMVLVRTQGVNVNSVDNVGRTPLSLAIQSGHEDVVKLLVKARGFDVNSKNDHGLTALSQAAHRGYEQGVKMLIETQSVDVNSKDNYGRTPLFLAAANGHEQIVKMLVETQGIDFNSKDNMEWTPLSKAAHKGNEQAVNVLIETQGVDVNSKDNYGRTPLFLAAANGHEQIVKMLIETQSVDVYSKDNHGRTPLFLAAANGHKQIVEMLVRKQGFAFDFNSKDSNGWTPLSWAAWTGHKHAITALIETQGVNVDSKDNNGRTPFFLAALRGHEQIIKILIQTQGVVVDVNLKDKYRLTPLLCAARNGQRQAVRVLVETQGVDINVEDELKRTPLFHAARFGYHEVVETLVKTHRAAQDWEDYYGSTALSTAIRNGHDKVAQVLLPSSRLCLTSKDAFGRTLGWWANRSGNARIVHLLAEHAGLPDIHDGDEGSVQYGPVTFNSTGSWCDTCTLTILPLTTGYYCAKCSNGNFAVCAECFDIGISCLDNSHQLKSKTAAAGIHPAGRPIG